MIFIAGCDTIIMIGGCMKGSLNKGFLNYILLFIGIILALFLVCLCIMLFSPGTSVLGFVYSKGEYKYEIKTLDGNDGTTIVDSEGNELEPSNEPTALKIKELSKLVVKSNCADIEFITGDLNFIEVNNYIRGFGKAKDIVPYKITKSYNAETGVLAITVVDSNYFLTLADQRKITICINDELCPLTKLEAISEKGDIKFGGTRNIEAKEHTFKAISGQTQQGDISVSQYIKFSVIATDLTQPEIALSTNNGFVNVAQTVSNFLLNRIDIESKNGKIKTGDLQAKQINLKGSTCIAEFQNLYGDVDLGIANGVADINDVQGNVIDSNEVVRNLQLSVGIVSGDVNIPKATLSNLIFDAIYGDCLLATESGNVVVRELRKKGEITTTNGKIELLVWKTNTNSINLNSDKGPINLYMQNVAGENTVITKGNVNLTYQEGLLFKLSATGKTIDLKNEDRIEKGKTVVGYPGVNDSEITTSNILTINTTNNVVIQRSANIVLN